METVAEWRKRLNVEFGLNRFRLRGDYVRNKGYVIVTQELADAIALLCKGRVVEVMAGTGYLASCLQECCVDVVATDDFSWHDIRKSDNGWSKHRTYTKVEQLDAREAARTADTVIMCWPYMDKIAHQVALAMKGGARLIYCGEGMHGCTASEEFFNYFETWPEAQHDLNKYQIQFSGMHDYWDVRDKPKGKLKCAKS